MVNFQRQAFVIVCLPQCGMASMLADLCDSRIVFGFDDTSVVSLAPCLAQAVDRFKQFPRFSAHS